MKNKVLTLTEHYCLFENPFDNLEETMEYQIKEKNKKKLLNKIVYSEQSGRYFKILPFFGEKEEYKIACDKCELVDKSIENCRCLINYEKTDLDSTEYDFYFKELNKYEVLFLGDKNGNY